MTDPRLDQEMEYSPEPVGPFIAATITLVAAAAVAALAVVQLLTGALG